MMVCGFGACTNEAVFQVSVPSYQQDACPSHLPWAVWLMNASPVDVRPIDPTDSAGRRWTTDYKTGARYVYINEGLAVTRTVEVGKGVQIDYNPDGTVVGIEFL
jgi:hypothetical protein